MTLGGLLKHMAWVEDWWFSQVLHDNPVLPPWDEIDWSVDPDWEWHSAADDSPEELRALWQAAVEKSRTLTEALWPRAAWGGCPTCVFDDGHAPSLRWIVTHMIEEYARHNGHADLLREAFDGQVGRVVTRRRGAGGPCASAPTSSPCAFAHGLLQRQHEGPRARRREDRRAPHRRADPDLHAQRPEPARHLLAGLEDLVGQGLGQVDEHPGVRLA